MYRVRPLGHRDSNPRAACYAAFTLVDRDETLAERTLLLPGAKLPANESSIAVSILSATHSVSASWSFDVVAVNLAAAPSSLCNCSQVVEASVDSSKLPSSSRIPAETNYSLERTVSISWVYWTVPILQAS